jgi:hypothetical protein
MHIIALNEGRSHNIMADYPGIYEGVRGMKFLEAVVASGRNGSARTAI